MSYDYLDLNSVNLELTEEHEALKQTLRKFAMDNLRPAAIELDKMSPEEVIKEDSLFWQNMKKIHKNNYHTALIPEELGGIGLDPIALHILFEEFAYASIGFAVALGVDFFPSYMSALIIAEYPELEDMIIRPFANDMECRLTGCWAITEPAHGSDILMSNTPYFRDPKVTQQLVGKKQGNEWVLNGQKSAWVSCGPTAAQASVFFGIDPSMGMAGGAIAIVDLDQKGVTRGKPLDKLGQRELPQGEIFFDNVEVPENRILCDQEAYEEMTSLILGVANAGMATYGLGAARAAFEEALTYSKERVQGGKPLCEHQDVQKKLANMFLKVEAARQMSRSVMNYNLTCFPPLTGYSIASKVFCTNAAFEIVCDAMQIFGGYGLSKEYLIEKLFRDIRATLIEDGSNDSLTLTIANHILFGEDAY
ncbi:MAG: acyl-CoA/acyl-ACP dehydrogenase [Deltaproteobacteria bacterium]|nr:acyl-CoA/acyl-ACP dehydrogenase [Deltaproteobacteria bacterium]